MGIFSPQIEKFEYFHNNIFGTYCQQKESMINIDS